MASYVPAKSTKTKKEKDEHQVTWSMACRKHGVAFVTRSDPRYEKIRATYEAIHPNRDYIASKKEAESRPENSLWKDCCKAVGVTFVKKGTPEYSRVMDLFVPKIKEKQEEAEPDNTWQGCCTQLGHSYVKKGTPEYESVLKLFKEKNAVQENSVPVLEVASV
jgi:hypothetical protein